MVRLKEFENMQLVLRTKPELNVYLRREPITYKYPTVAQALCRLKFSEVAEASKNFSIEEVAELVGGEVVEVEGRKAVKLPDGRLLTKHQAFIKAMLSGWRSGAAKTYVPKWLLETYYTYRRIYGLRERLLKPETKELMR